MAGGPMNGYVAGRRQGFDVPLHIVEAKSNVMAEFDTGELAESRLFADPGFWNSKLLGERLGVKEAWEAVAFDFAVACVDEPPFNK